MRGPAAVGRISGLQLTRAGQTNVLGHYPIHFHFVGDGGPNSFVQVCRAVQVSSLLTSGLDVCTVCQDSSFWHSYYRCVSIHATNGTRLSRNVAHDITGYCYYLEDGVENGNVRRVGFFSHISIFAVIIFPQCADH